MASVVPGGTTVKLDRLNIRRVAALTSLSLVGGFCERVNISEVDFQWVPRRRRSIDVEVRALALLRHDADLLSPRRRHARHVCRHPSAGHTRPELSQIHWAGRAPDLIGWRCRRKTKGNA